MSSTSRRPTPPNDGRSARQAMRVGITGGSGRVGTSLRRVLSRQLGHVRVIDIFEPTELEANESFHAADVTRLEQLVESFHGLDAIVHLAGLPGEADLADIVRINVLGASNLYEAAHRAGIRRVVVGSSSHTVGFYPRSQVVEPDAPMRPDSLYGLSKCWAELTAGLYFDKLGVESLLIRIGNALSRPNSRRTAEIWVSAEDLTQLVLIGLEHPRIDCTTVYGVSAGGGSWWNNSVATGLGYRPNDTADVTNPDLPGETGPMAEISEHFQGGYFSARGHDGVVRRRR